MDNSTIIIIIIIIVIVIGIFILINYKYPKLFEGGYTEKETLASFNKTYKTLIDYVILPMCGNMNELGKEYFKLPTKRNGLYALLTYECVIDDGKNYLNVSKFKYYYDDNKLIYINNTNFIEYNVEGIKLIKSNNIIDCITLILQNNAMLRINAKSIQLVDMQLLNNNPNFNPVYNYHQSISKIGFGQNDVFKTVCSPGHVITEKTNNEIHYGISCEYIDHDTIIEFIYKWYHDKGYNISMHEVWATTCLIYSKLKYYGVIVLILYDSICKEDKINFIDKDLFIKKLKNKFGDKFDGNDLIKFYIEYETRPLKEYFH